MNVPEKLINFRVYENGDDLIGVADVNLPKINPMTETVKGAGIAGEIDSPVKGHYSSMEVELNWRTVAKENIYLTSPEGKHLDIRGAMQIYDSGSSTYKVCPVKVVLRAVPKANDLGKLDVGAKTGSNNKLEVNYIKVDVDGKTLREIDKYNFIDKVGDVDYLADVREALGLN